MIPDSLRRRRLIAHILVAGAAIAVPVAAGASPEVVATRGLPSSVTAEYGASVPLGAPHPPGTFAIATRWGIEIWGAASADTVPLGSFRTAGVIRSLAAHGSTAYLFSGPRGIVAVDVADESAPEAIGSLGDLGDVSTGAVSGAGDALAVASDRGLHFIGISAPGAMTLRSTVNHADGRVVRAIAARSDSFLVASERLTPRRLFLTLYRFPSGAAAPESLREASVPLQAPSDLVWWGDLAFLAVGNAGVTVIRVPTGAVRITAAGSQFVSDLDVNDSLVVATLSDAGLLGKLRRAGSDGDSLVSFTTQGLQLKPTRVSLMGDAAVVSTQSTLSSEEPDEVARSMIELRHLDVPGFAAALGGTGRTRRAVIHAGYAYVADYTGGLRIYRAAGPDTSLVGVLPVTGFSRVMDVALDPPRGRAYLAGMSGGLLTVDVSDPSAPALLSALPFTEQVSAVAVIDSSLVVVGRRNPFGLGGLSFVDVTIPTGPVLRGEAAISLADPRAIAVKDTVAFVADALQGLFSVGFGDPDDPRKIGSSSGFGARDLDLSGNLLLVGTRGNGLQIVDVSLTTPQLRSTIFTPPIHGIARSENSVALFLADEGALVVDIADSFAPVARGPIAVPGSVRDGAWAGDTLLVAARTSLERFLVSPAPTSVPSLQIGVDPDVLAPRARISWTVGAPPSGPALVGWNLYRDTLPEPPSAGNPVGVRINDPLLPPATTQLVDDSVPTGVPLRYRLEGFFEDGSARKMAEGFFQIAPAPAAGRAYPNPYTPGSGTVTVPFTISLTDPGPVEATVHDTQGRLVRHMEVATAGGYGAVVWDGRNGAGRPVSSGIYFIRILGPDLDRTSRVVLVR